MPATHIAALIFAGLAGACELLAAFGKGDVAGVTLVPLGILFLIVAHAIWSTCHHRIH